jgi:prepilin-type processing-associated H-X9-DG protein
LLSTTLWEPYKDIAAGWPDNLSLQKESWIPDPGRFITMHEWGAYPFAVYDFFAGMTIVPWHNAAARGKVYEHQGPGWGYQDVYDTIQSAPERFVAPVLFADGHVTRCDFTGVIKKDPRHALDETKDWMWYKPRD